MSNKTFTLSDQLYGYMRSVAQAEPTALARLRAATAAVPLAAMQITPEQGQLMALLVRLIGAQKCLEVGVYTGYSSLAVALALPPAGTLVACDVSEEWTAIARRHWQEAGVAHKIRLVLQPALTTLGELVERGESGSFDFCFIDADKVNYDAYYEYGLKLVRAGGLIAIDNTLWGGKVADPKADDSDTEAIKALNRKLASDARVLASQLAIGDGLTLAHKR